MDKNELFYKYLLEKYPSEMEKDPEEFYSECMALNLHKRKWFLKYRTPDRKNYLYLTLSPDKFKRNIPESKLPDLMAWSEKWFSDKNEFYNGGVFVCEVGSDGNHPHIHALLDMKHSLKHALKLKKYWNKYFPDSPLLTSLNLCARGGKSNSRGEYCYANITDSEIVKDKLIYFNDEDKGSHENKYILMKPVFFGNQIKV